MGEQIKALPTVDLQQRLEELHRRIAAARHPTLTEREQTYLVEQLQCVLRELSAAEEELRQRNEAFAGAQKEAGAALVQKQAVDVRGITPAIQAEIAKRQRTEELLLRFSTTLEVSADSIVIGDLEGKILYANEAAWRRYGAEDGTGLIGRNALDLIALEERERAITGMSQALKTGRITSQEYQVINHVGARVPVESSTAIIRNDRGEAMGFENVLRDISERKRAEESLRRAHAELESRVRERTAELERINTALREEVVQRQRMEEAQRESAARVHALFENASDAVALFAVDGTTINVNRGAEILLHRARGCRRAESVTSSKSLAA